MEGTVKWFNRQKGYGFIQGEDGEEYFIHHSALAEGTFIRDNDKVGFEPAETERGKQAQSVTLLQKASEMEAEAPAEEEAKEEAPAEEEAKEEAKEEAPAKEKAKEEPAEESAEEPAEKEAKEEPAEESAEEPAEKEAKEE